jgi:hypothetical protein
VPQLLAGKTNAIHRAHVVFIYSRAAETPAATSAATDNLEGQMRAWNSSGTRRRSARSRFATRAQIGHRENDRSL